MSIRPVDFQIMIPRTSEVSKVHSDEEHKSQAIAQQQATIVQNDAENNVRQVHSQDKANEAKIREKQEKDRGNSKKRKQNKENKEEDLDKHQKTKPKEKTSIIDIRI